MGEFSVWHWMIVLMVVLLIFGGSRVSSVMGDVAKGIREFKKNLAEPTDDDADKEAPRDEPKQLPSKRRAADSTEEEKTTARRT